MRKLNWFLLVTIVLTLAVGHNGLFFESGATRMLRLGASPATAAEDSRALAPFVPTSTEVVERMLELAEVKKGDVVYDLGSGDGRIVITAAKKYGARGVGFEINPQLVQQSRENARREKVDHLVEFREQDIMTVDLSPATVVTMYLLPESNMKLRPRLWQQLKPGSRVVSHDFDMGDWSAEKVEEVAGENATLYLWRITGREKGRDLR